MRAYNELISTQNEVPSNLLNNQATEAMRDKDEGKTRHRNLYAFCGAERGIACIPAALDLHHDSLYQSVPGDDGLLGAVGDRN